jgi:hypothetical protein
MVPFEAVEGKTPRKIKVERKKRLFQQQDIEKLLEEMSVSMVQNKDFHFLPLEYFDDTSFDPRTPEEWQSFVVIIKNIIIFQAKLRERCRRCCCKSI